MTIWYTSDLHIGHRLVAAHRGYKGHEDPFESQDVPVDIIGHDADLASYWDNTVALDDTVFVLGDTGMGRFEQHVLPWFDARPGTKHLIAGNHDPVHPSRSDALKLQKRWLQTFNTINPYLTRKLNGHKVILSHFPYESWGEGPGRDGESRWNEWRIDESLGKPLLHGHTHGPETAHGRQLHVGWDARERFVSQEEVLEWLDTL